MIGKNRKKIIIIFIINTMVLFFFNYAHPVTPQLIQDRGASAELNGILFASMSLGMVVFASFWGKYLYDIKPKKLMILALIGYGISQQMLGFIPHPFFMCLGRFFSGAFASAWVVSMYEYVHVYTVESKKTKFFGYILVSNSLAAIFGQLSSGYLGTHISIYYIFIIQLIGLFLIAILVYFAIPKVVKDKKLIHDKEKKHKKNKNIFSGLNILYKEGNIPILLVMVLFSLALTAYTSQIGYYAQDILSGSSLLISELNSYTSLVILLMNFFMVSILDKNFSFNKIVSMQFIFAFIGIFLIFILGGFTSFISISLFLMGLVITVPIFQRNLVKNTNLESNEALGFATSANSLGMVLGASLSGFAYENKPEQVIFLIISALTLGLIIFLLGKLQKSNKNRRGYGL